MTNFLKDCDSVVSKIDKGTLNKRDLDAIIDEYNACIQNNTTNHTKLISERVDQTPKIKVSKNYGRAADEGGEDLCQGSVKTKGRKL